MDYGERDWVFDLIENLEGTGEVREEKLTVSPNYAIDFSMIQGFIELVQNALDVRDEYGANVSVFTEGNKLYIANDSASIGVEDFYLGKTSKREDITPCLPRGYFGTGLTKGIVVLLRSGYRVKAYTYYGIIEPVLDVEDSEKYGKIEVIALRVTRLRTKVPATIFEISGSGIYDVCRELFWRILDLREIDTYAPKGINNVFLVMEFPKKSRVSEVGAKSKGYHRGIYITDIESLFSYNFCRRDLMQQESRNDFTDIDELKEDIAMLWKYMDRVDLARVFIDLRIALGDESCYEDKVRWKYPVHKDVWVRAWKELFGNKYITNKQMVYLNNLDKFVLVPTPLYEWLKSAGVPSEESAGLEKVEIVRYNLSRDEMDRLDRAVKIASVIAGKRTDEAKNIYYMIKSTVYKNVYSRAILIDREGNVEDKTGELAFVWNGDIKHLYVRDDVVRDFNEISIAVILLHELAHTKEVGALYQFPDGFDHYKMYIYYESIIKDIIQMITMDKINDMISRVFG